MKDKELIAACGIYCGICKYYYREKNQCQGCRQLDKKSPETRFKCIVRECEILKERNWLYCSDKCENYPCRRLRALDKRYSTKYHMSMLENLDYIKKHGTNAFLDKQEEKWECPNCGGIVTCHGGKCMNCGYEKFKN